MGEYLASDIPLSTVEPDVYVVPSETTFTMKSLTVYAVYKKLKVINERKAAGLDKIPCKLLRIAAEIVAPSLKLGLPATINRVRFVFWRIKMSAGALIHCRFVEMKFQM